jgi:hypothetical protein
MLIRLTRYRVKSGKSERADEWMAMLNARLDECLATFVRERMYIEIVFRERQGDEDYLYWFTIRGEGGEHMETSNHPLDHDHLAFWRECIDPTYNEARCKVEMELQVAMIPRFLFEMMRPENL